MDLSLAPKQPCQMKSQREFCKSKLLPLFSLLLSFTELAILQTLQSPLSTQTIPSFSLLLSFTELAILQNLQSPLSTQTIPSFSLLLSFTELAIFFYRTC